VFAVRSPPAPAGRAGSAAAGRDLRTSGGIIERVSNLRSRRCEDDPEDAASDEAEIEDAPVVDREIENFRGALKAATLALRVPIQMVWPTTCDNDAVVKRKLAEFSSRKVQHRHSLTVAV
jgi:hypothetical protein